MNTVRDTIQNTGKHLYNLPFYSKVVIIVILLLVIAGSIVLGLYLGGIGVFKKDFTSAKDIMDSIVKKTKVDTDTTGGIVLNINEALVSEDSNMFLIFTKEDSYTSRIYMYNKRNNTYNWIKTVQSEEGMVLKKVNSDINLQVNDRLVKNIFTECANSIVSIDNNGTLLTKKNYIITPAKAPTPVAVQNPTIPKIKLPVLNSFDTVKQNDKMSFTYKKVRYNVSYSIEDMNSPVIQSMVKQYNFLLLIRFCIEHVIDTFYKSYDVTMGNHSISVNGCDCSGICDGKINIEGKPYCYTNNCVTDAWKGGYYDSCDIKSPINNDFNIDIHFKYIPTKPTYRGEAYGKTMNVNLFNLENFMKNNKEHINEVVFETLVHEFTHIFTQNIDSLNPVHVEALAEYIRSTLGFDTLILYEPVLTKENVNSTIYPKFDTKYGVIPIFFFRWLNEKFPDVYVEMNQNLNDPSIIAENNKDAFINKAIQKISKTSLTIDDYWLEYMKTLPEK